MEEDKDLMAGFLEKFQEAAKNRGNDMNRTFESFLDGILTIFSINDKGSYSGRPDDMEDDMLDLITEWLKVVSSKCSIFGWYDAIGEIYENCVIGSGTRKMNQSYYTPVSIADVMAEFFEPDQENSEWCSDPTCGSGRNLLALHAKNPKLKCFAEDLDQTACKVCACNFLVHGIEGVVICHDTLMRIPVHFAYEVNRGLQTNGFPHVKKIDSAIVEKMYQGQ